MNEMLYSTRNFAEANNLNLDIMTKPHKGKS